MGEVKNICNQLLNLLEKNMGYSNKGREYSGLKSSLSTANGNNMEMETNMLRLHRTSR